MLVVASETHLKILNGGKLQLLFCASSLFWIKHRFTGLYPHCFGEARAEVRAAEDNSAKRCCGVRPGSDDLA
jgi:hypothetical protein